MKVSIFRRIMKPWYIRKMMILKQKDYNYAESHDEYGMEYPIYISKNTWIPLSWRIESTHKIGLGKRI